jgi:hypothetical protein
MNLILVTRLMMDQASFADVQNNHLEQMKTIIAGSRTIQDYSLVETAIHQSGFPISEVVSGGSGNQMQGW